MGSESIREGEARALPPASRGGRELRSDDVAAIARRAARRALDGAASPPPAAIRGVHAKAVGASPRYEDATRAARADRQVVTAESLAAVPDGARFPVAPGARVTPLASDEAAARGIRFVAGRAAEMLPPRALRIALASDHAGFAVKSELAAVLRELGHRVLDVGTASDAPCDYPDFAAAAARAVSDGRADLGVVVDGAGIGSAIVANKVPGVRAAPCRDEREAMSAREHNHANVLALGAAGLGREAARAIVAAFLATAPGAGRHAARVEKLRAVEAEFLRAPRSADTFDPAR